MTFTQPEFVFYTLTTEAGTTWWMAKGDEIAEWAHRNMDLFVTWDAKVSAFLQSQCYEGDGAWVDRASLTTRDAWYEAYAWGMEDGTQAGPAYYYYLQEDYSQED